ncbi:MULTISPECIES: exosporium leader peptide-containing protein [Bacillus]|uniref:exosporium leader peptide-containing protein n=1 Tax=Bacillus TaxID=1386 RepID=UPI0009B3CC85|nr:exosporium leader peptide-containing protein [Bacillus cereus]HDR5276729.1 exosporium leader peptide-containing protein [Bacillus thuringiensis]
MSKENQFDPHGILHGAALDPSSIGPTLPPTPTFTIPTGTTGSTGPSGATGPIIQSAFRAISNQPQNLSGFTQVLWFCCKVS